LQASMSWGNKRNRTYINIYSESDARNQPLQQDLSDSDKLQLSQAGDDPLAAITSGIQNTTFTNSQILYTSIDSLGYSDVLVFTTDSSATLFRVTFSYVGAGKGDYIEDGFEATGKKYKWVNPETVGGETIHQGNYAPVALLAAPKKNQMLTAGHEMTREKAITNGTRQHQIKTEGAWSNKDLNTFSSIDNADNQGWAGKMQYSFTRTRKDSTDGRSNNKTLKSVLAYEYNHQNFSSIERFREVEFNRNWNLGAVQPFGALQMAKTEVQWGREQSGILRFGGEWLSIQGWGEGIKGQTHIQWRNKRGFQALVQASLLNTAGAAPSRFVRHKSEISKSVRKMRFYYRDEHERNLFFLNSSDSLSALSYQFYDWETGVGTADTLKKNITLYYRNRFENRLDDSALRLASIADQYGVTARWNANPDRRLALFVSNRRLRVLNTEAISTEPENTLVTRLEYFWRYKNGFLQSTTFYETGSGLEQRKEYVYLEVQPGQGNFVWVDYNQNGIKELNEFEVALYAYEANYIRSSIQSNEYIRTYTNQVNQSLSIQPDRLIKKRTGWRKWVAKLSAQSTIRLDRKNTSDDGDTRFNPLAYDEKDTSLLSLNGLMRHVVFINKSNPVFNAECTYQESGGKNLLSNGFETRSEQFLQTAARYTWKKTWTIQAEWQQGTKRAASDFLNGRNYVLETQQVQPVLTWQPGNTKRINLKTQYADKRNTEGVERAVIQRLGLEAILSDVKKGSLQCEVNYYKITYNGPSNNSLAFDMLEGLNAGNNMTWAISVQRRIAKNLQLNLNYSGRKPENIPTIHAGGLQLRAFF
ncbi:MAG: hypothetical protein RLZZ262_2599, partial [Bacteroidota bacterium]